jgi:ABC-type multidrug transport system ATPase subunit
VVIDRLVKVYSGSEEKKRCCGETSAPQLAVNELCLGIQSNTLLCLLGPNGAGKVRGACMQLET